MLAAPLATILPRTLRGWQYSTANSNHDPNTSGRMMLRKGQRSAGHLVSGVPDSPMTNGTSSVSSRTSRVRRVSRLP